MNLAYFQITNDRTIYQVKLATPTKEGLQISVNFKDYDLYPYTKLDVSQNSVSLESNTFKWAPSVGMDGNIFPSMVISTATWSDEAKEQLVKVNKGIEILGDPLGAFTVTIMNIKPEAKVKVEIALNEIANNSSFEASLSKNKIYAIKPYIDYNYQKLLELRQPIPLNVMFTLFVDGEKVGEQFKTITVRSINDAPLMSLDKNNQVIDDFRFIYAAYVNENNPNIDSILREALNTGEISSFDGYQSGYQGVYKQVYAIWNALQRRGVRYSSITTPSAESNKVFSQSVRFFDDSLNTAQANCIDGTVLFASILRKIGINPKIILIPGHAFLGFDLDTSGNQVAYLETTLIGSTDLGNIQRKSLDERLSKVLGVQSQKNRKSYSSFTDAINEGARKASSALLQLQMKNPNYKIIDINKARKIGIAPISH